MKIRPRTVTAALTAPPVGAVVAFVLVVVLLDLAEELGPRGLGLFLRDFARIGSAVAYLAAALVGIPAYRYLWRRERLTFRSTIAVSTFAGMAAFLPVLVVLSADVAALVGTVLVGAVSGACAGAWFWLVAFGRRRPEVHQQAS